MKTKILITAMGLGLSLNAFAFYNQGANTGADAKAPVEQSMTAPVNQEMEAPISQEMSSPADKVAVDQAEIARKLEEEAKREAQAKAARERQAQMDQAAIARQLEEEAKREARAKAERERQERIAAERAKRKAEAAAKKAARQEAIANAKKLGQMRNEAINFVGSLNLVEMEDRLKFKAHYDKMVEIANGDKSNEHVEAVGLIGARQYHSNALSHVQEHGQYLFADAKEAREWGFRAPPGLSKGEYVEIIETWPERLQTGQEMLNLAEKYANLGDKQAKEFAQFQSYLDWRQGELQEQVDYAKQMQSEPEYNPDDRMSGGITLGDIGSGALNVTKDLGGKAINGIKSLADKCFWNCN